MARVLECVMKFESKDEKLLNHEIYNIDDIHEPTLRKKAQEVFDRLDKLLEESDDELVN